MAELPMSLAAYLPRDRYKALRRDVILPEHTVGTALFADLAGFTPFADALAQQLGARHGAEELTRHLNVVYEALIAPVDRFRGSVIGFSGDAITCWFAEGAEGGDADAAARAAACAVLQQAAMEAVAALTLPGGATLTLGLKVAVASGAARRFLVGDPQLQVLDVLAGAPVSRLAMAEHLAGAGEVLLDEPTIAALGTAAQVASWRSEAATGARYAVLDGLAAVGAAPWEDDQPALPDAPLRPWLLPAVYARHQAGLGDFLTELRPVVALFLGFAGIDYQADADAGTKLDTFIRRVQEVLARYEGALVQLTVGDKGSNLLAAFGAPVAHEDDARRAVMAAAALQALAGGLEFLAPPRIGLSAGLVRAGTYGSTTRRIYSVQGDEVNLAARLMGRAAPGEVLLSGRVQTALGDAFALEPLSPQPFKGLPEPIPVFRLIGQHAHAMHLTEPNYALPMAGRAAELRLIEERMERVLAGQGQVVGITAEAGMGKSRLVAEALRLGRRRGLRALGGACQSFGTSTPYLVWGPIWRGFFGLDPEAPVRRQVRMLEGEVEDLAPDRVEALPLLGPLLGLPLPENEFTRTLEPQHRKPALEALLLDCLRTAANEARHDGGGLLVVLEDLHWIDPTSHDLLELMAKESTALPVLFVLAYRPPELLRLQAPRMEALPHFTRVTLDPLTLAEAEQVIRAKLAQLLPQRRGLVTPALVERIMARAEGNPFYVEELLNYLHDRGIDPRDVAMLQTLELPTSLHSLILSRIDQLTAGQQVTLKVASVLGRLVRFAWLHGAYHSLGPAPQMKDNLDELSRLDLTPLDTPEPELAYLFKHVVTQEVAYESLAHATRATLHEQLAAYLEGLAGEDDALVDLLAYHYERSANGAKARVYLRRAGESAAARFANVAAADYFTRALALTPALAAPDRYALLRGREAVYEILGERGAQRRDLEALTEVAAALGDPGRRSEAALRRAVLEEEVSDLQAAASAARRAVALARDAGLAAAEAAAQFQLGWILWNARAHAEAHAPLERSLDLARALGDGRLESRVLGSLGVVADLTHDIPLARRYYEQSLRAAQTTGDRVQEAKTLHDLGGLEKERGEYARGQMYLEQSLSIVHITGDRLMEGYAIHTLAGMAQRQGNYPGAHAGYEQSLAIFRALVNRKMEGSALGQLGWVALCAGDYAGAHTSYTQALAIAREIGIQQSVNNISNNLGTLARNQGDGAGACVLYEQALAGARAIDDRREEGTALWGLGNVALDAGHLEEAAAAFGAAMAAQQAVERPGKVQEAVAGLARVALAQGDLPVARTHAAAILAYLDEGGTLNDAEEPLGVVLTYYRVLQAVGDPCAGGVLEAAYKQLCERATRFSDEGQRRLFLENVPHHRDLVAAWAGLHAAGGS